MSQNKKENDTCKVKSELKIKMNSGKNRKLIISQMLQSIYDNKDKTPQ
jgi:hypothetical protein